MNEATIAWILLIPALIVQIIFLFKKNDTEKPDRISSVIILVSAALLLASFVRRSLAISFVALTNTFESLVFYGAMICVIDIVYRFQKRLPYHKSVSFMAILTAFVLLSIASSPLTSKDAFAPVPALRSFWLLLHVSFAFIGESFFVVSFAASLAFLFTKNDSKRDGYDRVSYISIAVGYPFFTAGALIFGAIWAQKAWGTWWSWDPKETWALITWFVYTLYLHQRLISRKSGKIPAIISVIGFLCTIFSFFGVNYLLPGLHSYK